jgi:hypothetical protein
MFRVNVIQPHRERASMGCGRPSDPLLDQEELPIEFVHHIYPIDEHLATLIL